MRGGRGGAVSRIMTTFLVLGVEELATKMTKEEQGRHLERLWPLGSPSANARLQACPRLPSVDQGDRRTCTYQ